MEIALLPLITAIILNVAIAMAWYSSKLLGHAWVTALGFNMRQLKATPTRYVSAIVVTGVMVTVTAILIKMFHIHTSMEAIKLGFLLWLGFIATSHFSGVLWAKKPLKVYFIDTSYLLIVILLNALLLTLWK